MCVTHIATQGRNKQYTIRSIKIQRLFKTILCASLLLTLYILASAKTHTTEPSNYIEAFSKNIFTESSTIRKRHLLDPVVKLSMFSPAEVIGSGALSGLVLGSATGFSVSYDPETNTSMIITNDHFCNEFIENTSLILIAEGSRTPRINGPTKDFSTGTVLKTNPEKDLCLVSIIGFFQPALLAGKDYNIQATDEVTIVGGPSGTFPIITDTYISGHLDREEVGLGGISKEGNKFLFISGFIFPGHSGSPVYNKQNQVIGVIFASLPTYGCIAIQIKDLHDFLET